MHTIVSPARGPSGLWDPSSRPPHSISRVIIGVIPFRVLITVLITYLLSSLPLQVILNEREKYDR